MGIINSRVKEFFDRNIPKLSKEKIIIDIGGGNPFQKDMFKYKKYFNNNYFTLDVDVRYKPSIIGDAVRLPFKSENIPVILCKSLLEHVPEPSKAVDEFYRVIKSNGICLVYLPFLYSYHAREGYYKDYFRFSKDAVRFLFRKFQIIELYASAGPFETFINLLPQFISKVFAVPTRIIDRLKIGSNQVSGYLMLCRKTK